MSEFTGVITEPGLYGDIPEWAYHLDPVEGGSLSVSGAKLLLPPSCPAEYDYRRRHPQAQTKAMSLGTVVHALILGKGQECEVIAADSYRTKAAQEARDAAVAEDKIPMLTAEYDKALAIEAAVRDDDTAGPLFDSGDAEQSLFWRDPDWDIWLRARLDWLTHFDGFPCVADVKTTADASPREFAKSADKYRYYMQDPHYRDGLAAILGCHPDEIDFLFVTVQTEEPYYVMTYRLQLDDVELGRQCNAIAREIYRDCSKAGIWPRWSESITDLPLPPYARRRIEGEISDYFD